jgi:Uma2 family endonuclease
MDGPHKKNASLADVEALPEGKVGELIDGDLYICGRPRSPHARALGSVLRQVDDDDDSPDGWVILAEVEIWFGKNRKNLLVPDISGWRRARMPEMPDVPRFDLVPDWVCECLSPSTARLDRGRKREIYAKHKVGHIWYVDPELRTVDVYTLDGSTYRVTQTGELSDRGVFPPFTQTIDLAKLWRR